MQPIGVCAVAFVTHKIGENTQISWTNLQCVVSNKYANEIFLQQQEQERTSYLTASSLWKRRVLMFLPLIWNLWKTMSEFFALVQHQRREDQVSPLGSTSEHLVDEVPDSRTTG